MFMTPFVRGSLSHLDTPFGGDSGGWATEEMTSKAEDTKIK